MNIVLICLDSFRADCIAAAGRNSFINTPHLDRLAAEGILFENAFGEGQPTIQFRRALCTGMRSFPWRTHYDTKGSWPNAMGWHKIPPEQPTLAEILLDAGYTTTLVSDTYHMFKPTMNFTRGMTAYEFIRGQENDNYRIGPLSALDLSKYLIPDSSMGKSILYQYLLNMQDRTSEEDYLPGKVFTTATRLIKEMKERQPFFLWIDSFAPHEPYDPPKHYADMYDHGWDEDWEPIIGVESHHDEKIRKRYIAHYYGYCTFVDKWIGRVIDILDATGIADDTMIIVASDHGVELMDHGSLLKMCHRCRYRHNSEILFLMRLPGREYAGKRVKGFVQNHDIVPTILKACGVKHEPVNGKDVIPLVTGEKETLRDCIITGWTGPLVNVRDHEYSYTCNYVSKEREEWLYDIKSDPNENNNIASDHPGICAEAIARLEKFFESNLPIKLPEVKNPTSPPSLIWLEKSNAERMIFKGHT